MMSADVIAVVLGLLSLGIFLGFQIRRKMLRKTRLRLFRQRFEKEKQL